MGRRGISTQRRHPILRQQNKALVYRRPQKGIAPLPSSKSDSMADPIQELIKVRGFQVAPPELEAVLLEAKDDIVDVAVIGLKAKPGSDAERPRAYVVRKPGSDITEEGVKRLISDNLASYKKLSGGVVFLDEVPKSPSGKILKRVLREWADAEEKEGMAKL
jgi:4-coumarate--CoA ligase